MKPTQQIKQYLTSFHENEDGIEALQVVMIIAVAAIALILVRVFWNELAGFARGMFDEVVDKPGTAPGDSNWKFDKETKFNN